MGNDCIERQDYLDWLTGLPIAAVTFSAMDLFLAMQPPIKIVDEHCLITSLNYGMVGLRAFCRSGQLSRLQ
jgi:hypothetical protein